MKVNRRIHISMWTLALGLTTFHSSAQGELETVEVVGSRLEWSHLPSDARIDTLESRQIGDLSLAERVNAVPSIYIRSYGPGLSSTISQHGFSPSQTSVYWYGVPLNSPALGLTDLSTITSDFEVVLDKGAGSNSYGSGYMGGGIHLFQSGVDTGFTALQSAQYRTSGLYSFNTTLAFGSKRSSHQINFDKVVGDLDYAYTDLYGVERKRLGADQDQIQLRYTGNQKWGVKDFWEMQWGGWYSDLDRGIPRSISESYTPGARQFDIALRSFARLSWGSGNGRYKATAQVSGFHENQQYESTTVVDTNIANALYSQVNFYAKVNERFSWTAGVDHAYQFVEGSSKDPRGVHRTGASVRGDLHLTEAWLLAVGARMEHQIKTTPVIPVAELAWSKGGWQIQGSYRSHYRFPTLNDLFWQPGGNEDLKPEVGQAVELLLSKSWKWAGIHVKPSVSGFIADVDNYILWLPTGAYFIPMNVRKVQSYGATTKLEVDWKMLALDWKVNGGYTWTRSQTVSSTNASDPSIDHQLIYTPEHKANSRMDVAGEFWSAYVQYSWTGIVHTTTDNDIRKSIDPYGLLDAGVGYRFKFKSTSLLTEVGVRNALNEEYYQQRFYPKPGVQGVFTITIQFNSNEK